MEHCLCPPSTVNQRSSWKLVAFGCRGAQIKPMPIRQLLYAMDFGNASPYASHECWKKRHWQTQNLAKTTTVTGHFGTKVVLLASNLGKEKGEIWHLGFKCTNFPNIKQGWNHYQMHQHAKQHHLKHSYDRLVSIPINEHQKGQQASHEPTNFKASTSYAWPFHAWAS